MGHEPPDPFLDGLREQINTMSRELSEWRAFGPKFRFAVMGHEHESTRRANDCAPDVLTDLLKRLEATLGDHRKLCTAVRVAACGESLSMGDRFAELAVIVKERDEAKERVVQLETLATNGGIPGEPNLVQDLRAKIRPRGTRDNALFGEDDISKVLDTLTACQRLLQETMFKFVESHAEVEKLREEDTRLREGWRVQVKRKDMQLDEAMTKIAERDKECVRLREKAEEIYAELVKKTHPIEWQCLVVVRMLANNRIGWKIGEVGVFRLATDILEKWINEDYFGKEMTWREDLPNESVFGHIDAANWPTGSGIIIRSGTIIVPKPITRWGLEAAP